MISLQDKVVVICGGTGGLGEAVTDAFLAEGARVIGLWHRTPPRVHENLIPLQVDIPQSESLRTAMEEALKRTGRIDALVNMVGAYAGGRLAETSDETWNRILSLNLSAAFLTTRSVLPHMIGRRSGRILHVGARAGAEPFAGAAAYVTSKAALMALVRVAALELEGTGVRINAVLPRIIDTPDNRRNMPDADPSRWLPPASLARTLLWLASDSSGEINGALIPVG